ncbi:MAG: single-stranded DNA-binding protein [Christensenellaceae bacterium]|jgi:single-strand DNA-binding protein|nr:single-stranded DNA-binding protein [Christensenellaceae bacterium]
MNLVTVSGHVVRDAVLSTSAAGVTRCSFAFAINEQRSDKNITTYLQIVAWGPYAAVLKEHAIKGSKLLIHGRILTRMSETQRRITEIVVEHFETMRVKDSTAQVNSDEETCIDEELV